MSTKNVVNEICISTGVFPVNTMKFLANLFIAKKLRDYKKSMAIVPYSKSNHTSHTEPNFVTLTGSAQASNSVLELSMPEYINL